MPAQQPQSFYDYDVEAEDLRRRQAVADAMQASSRQPLQLASGGNLVTPAHWSQALAKVLEGYLGEKEQRQLKTDRSAMAERAQADLVSGMEQLAGARSGENPREAVFAALSAKHPLVRQMAMQQIAEMGKGTLTPTELAKYAVPEDVVKNPANPAAWRGKRDLKELTPGNALVDSAGNFTAPAGQPNWQTANIGGDLYQASPTGLKKLDNAPKVSVNASPVIQAQRSGLGEYYKSGAEQVKALGQAANSAAGTKQAIAQLRELDNKGVFSNATTGPATFLANVSQAFGIPADTSKLSNTEAYNAGVNKLWLALQNEAGGARGLVKEESQKVMEMLPLASHSPQARRTIMEILDRAASRQIDQFKRANQAYTASVQADDPRIFGKAMEGVYVPEMGAAPVPGQPAGAQSKNSTLPWLPPGYELIGVK